MSGQLPRHWPGRKRVMAACTTLRLRGYNSDFLTAYAADSKSRQRSRYGAFRRYYNVWMGYSLHRGD